MAMNIRKYMVTAAIVAASIPIASIAVAAEDDLGADPAVQILTTPQSEISAGAEYIFEDASRFGKYSARRDGGAYPVLDLTVVTRDNETGAWIKFTDTDLGFDNRELRFELERQGNWNSFIDFSQLPVADPLTISTGLTGIGTNEQSVAGTGVRGVELETRRNRLKFGFGKHLGRGFDVSVDFSREEKDGERLWGAQGFNFLTEPIEFIHQKVNAQLDFKSARLQMSGGYLGSFFANQNKVLVNDSDQTEISLPLDNEAHQLFLTGGYSLTPTTRATFKVSQARTFQNDDYYMPAVFAGNGSNSLNAEVRTTLAQLGLSSRPLRGLTVNAKLRYEDRNDKTPRKQYVIATATTDGFNVPYSRSTANADLRLGYQLPQKFKLTGGVEFEHWTRSMPPLRQISTRRTTDEITYRIKLRRSLSETLGGSIGYEYGARKGSRYLPTGSTEVIDPITWADRKRNKGRLSLSWIPVDGFSLQLLSEYSLDNYDGRELGPRDGSAFLTSIDASLEIAEQWNVTAWVSHAYTNVDQATNCPSVLECGGVATSADWVADLTQTNSAVGLGTRANVTGRFEVGFDTAFSIDRSDYEIETIGGTKLSYLPVITYKHVNVSMFADYRIGDNNGLRLIYGFDWTIADDWTWEGWTYADGTTLSIPTKQNTHFVGLSYYHRF
jgi:MtrB/PioB family decaheme-associated outer membrane protein